LGSCLRRNDSFHLSLEALRTIQPPDYFRLKESSLYLFRTVMRLRGNDINQNFLRSLWLILKMAHIMLAP
ncbi:MAG: hypothetical protein AB7U63_16370, partial [Porticoccaceae bacterium]